MKAKLLYYGVPLLLIGAVLYLIHIQFGWDGWIVALSGAIAFGEFIQHKRDERFRVRWGRRIVIGAVMLSIFAGLKDNQEKTEEMRGLRKQIDEDLELARRTLSSAADLSNFVTGGHSYLYLEFFVGIDHKLRAKECVDGDTPARDIHFEIYDLPISGDFPQSPLANYWVDAQEVETAHPDSGLSRQYELDASKPHNLLVLLVQRNRRYVQLVVYRPDGMRFDHQFYDLQDKSMRIRYDFPLRKEFGGLFTGELIALEQDARSLLKAPFQY